MPITIESADLPPRSVPRSLLRGFRCRCPACGEARLFTGYLKAVATCPACGEDLSHQRADDAPPYFTIVVVGHIVVPAMLAVEMRGLFAPMTSMVFWPALTLVLALLFLQPIKGAIIGLQWALRMHGFDGAGDPNDPQGWPLAAGEKPPLA